VLKSARSALVEGRYAEARDGLANLRTQLAPGQLRDQATILQGQAVRLLGEFQQAADLFEQVSLGAGPQAEQALFLLAQTYGRDLRQPARTAVLWESYQRRFGSGIFLEEAAFRRAEALVASGQHSAGLQALSSYLSDYPQGPRADEVHLLVAAAMMNNGKWEAALAHTIAVTAPQGRIVEQAQIRRARCLQALGRAQEARALYRAYLEHWPRGELSAEARKQLSRLPAK
jgi:TolA-binding protein